jgi:hypothetical protein
MQLRDGFRILRSKRLILDNHTRRLISPLLAVPEAAILPVAVAARAAFWHQRLFFPPEQLTQ